MAAISAAVSESLPNEDKREPVPTDEDSQPVEPYYWEAGGNSRIDWWGKLRHQMHYGGIRAVGAAEAIGEVLASTLGLTDSKYQYVIDALELDEYRREREERDEEDRRKMEAERAERSQREEGSVVDSQPLGMQASDDDGGIELGQAALPAPAGAQEQAHAAPEASRA